MRRWSIVIVVYFCSVVACLNQFKVPPVTGMLMQHFHVDSTVVGWMMSIFSLTGIILAFPAAGFLKRLGPTKSGLTAMGCIIIGCIVGALAMSSSALMTGRVIEGIGLSLIAVIAPAVIAMNFKPEEVGLPMGIWATWFPVGSSLGYNITHPVTQAFGSWQSIWWVGGALAAVGFILYGLVVKRPSEGGSGHGHGASDISFLDGLKNLKIWMLGIAFFFIMMGSLGFLTWAPEFLIDKFGLGHGVAAATASLGFIWSAPGGIVAGFVLSRLMSKRNAVFISFVVLSAITYPFAFILPQSVMAPFLSLTGFIMGFICAASFAMVPKTMATPALAGLGMGVIIFSQSWANFLAPPAMGHLISGGHYARAVVPTAIVELLGLAAAIAFAKVKGVNED